MNNEKPKIRAIPLATLIHGRLRKELKIIFDEVLEDADAYNTCVICEHFNEEKETCALAAGQRPPARTIAFGCEKFAYVGDDVVEAGLSVRKNIPVEVKDIDVSKLKARNFFDAENKEAVPRPLGPSVALTGMARDFEDTFFKHHPNHGVEENY